MAAGATDLFGLTEHVAIVVGGSRGIGFALAEGLASAGAVVVIADLLAEQAEKAAEVLWGKGLQIAAEFVDVT